MFRLYSYIHSQRIVKQKRQWEHSPKKASLGCNYQIYKQFVVSINFQMPSKI